MQDIADQVGVSRMAVSVALHGTTSNVGVSESTRTRIVEAARQLQYRPNAIARALRRRKTDIIGVYSGYSPLFARTDFLSQIIAGAEEGCAAHGKNLLLHTSFGGQSTDEIYAELVDGRIDGLVVFSPPEDPLAEQLAKSHLPVVAVADAIPGVPSVVVDDEKGARLTFDYLASRGHRRVTYRSLKERLVSAERRRVVFLETARRTGLDVEEWCAPKLLHGEDSYLRNLAQRPSAERPTAIVCWNDESAYDLLAHCRRQGIRVPDQLAVVGFDGDQNPIDFHWRLTTIRAPWMMVARTAVTLVAKQLADEEVPAESILPVELVVGDSA